MIWTAPRKRRGVQVPLVFTPTFQTIHRINVEQCRNLNDYTSEFVFGALGTRLWLWIFLSLSRTPSWEIGFMLSEESGTWSFLRRSFPLTIRQSKIANDLATNCERLNKNFALGLPFQLGISLKMISHIIIHQRRTSKSNFLELYCSENSLFVALYSYAIKDRYLCSY